MTDIDRIQQDYRLGDAVLQHITNDGITYRTRCWFGEYKPINFFVPLNQIGTQTFRKRMRPKQLIAYLVEK